MDSQEQTIVTPEKASTMTVLLVEPNKYPRPAEMEPGLVPLQEAVGGDIEAVYPFADPVAIICNDEGKINGMPLNRALRDDAGEIYDILAGPVVIVGLGKEDFCSLTPEQMDKFSAMFRQPEAFIKMGHSIMSFPVPDDMVEAGSKPKQSAKSHNVQAL